MYPTYEQIKKVSQDTTLTPSQRLHELFKNSKTEPLSTYIDEDFLGEYPLDPSVRLNEADVVEVNADGQIIVFRYPDNTYHVIDSGATATIEGSEYISPESLDDFDEETTQQYYNDLLMTDDSPLTFYRGGWVDKDLQSFFLSTYPA